MSGDSGQISPDQLRKIYRLTQEIEFGKEEKELILKAILRNLAERKVTNLPAWHIRDSSEGEYYAVDFKYLQGYPGKMGQEGKFQLSKSRLQHALEGGLDIDLRPELSTASYCTMLTVDQMLYRLKKVTEMLDPTLPIVQDWRYDNGIFSIRTASPSYYHYINLRLGKAEDKQTIQRIANVALCGYSPGVPTVTREDHKYGDLYRLPFPTRRR